MIVLESLESRTLFAGVTIITHGFEDTTTGWVSTMADAIADRAGGKSAVAIYTLDVGLDSRGKLAVLDFDHQANTATLTTASSGQTIIKLNWSTVSDGTYSTVQVGDVAANWLMATPAGLPPLDQTPIDLIGHSRGASLNTEIAKDLGEHGIWVDQMTSLDPHPVNGSAEDLGISFGDEPMITWSNIVFADDYWRSGAGGTPAGDPDGQAVTGAYNLNLQASVESDFVSSAHDSVHAWYFGTIDPKATSDGDGITIPSAWYGNTKALPPRNDTGFHYTLIAGGKRPAAGLSPAFGGTAARTNPGEHGTQWADVGNISLSTTSLSPGQSFKINFSEEDRQSASKVVFYLDTDQNPYNANNVRTLARGSFEKTSKISAKSLKAGTTGVAAGTYYVCAQITTAGGQTRYEYASEKVKIT